MPVRIALLEVQSAHFRQITKRMEGSMALRDLVVNNRSYRRFYEDVAIGCEVLKELVDLARLSASGANLQPLKYMLSCDADTNALVFPHLGWAGYLKDWPGPAEGERPSAYIIILGDTEIRKSVGCDHGIGAQSILLGATERGLGGCMIASVQKERLREALEIPSRYEILLVIALGKPKETVIIEPLGPDGDIKYWRDDEGRHHVPKRALDDIIID
jgi:nitroreductase